MIRFVCNPKYFRYGDVKTGDIIVFEKYKSGIKTYEKYGEVIGIPNENYCTVKFTSLVSENGIQVYENKYRYLTSINFWKGEPKEENSFDEIDEDYEDVYEEDMDDDLEEIIENGISILKFER